MDALTQRPRLLVKLPQRPDAQPKNLQIGGANLQFSFDPLFDPGAIPANLAAAPAPNWYAMTATGPGNEVNTWDLCHRLVRGEVGLAVGETPLFAEPDLQQRWLSGSDSEIALAAASICPATPQPSNLKLPPHSDSDHFWFLDDQHSQLEDARQVAGDPGDQRRVRIAHLDTGYDPQQSTLRRSKQQTSTTK